MCRHRLAQTLRRWDAEAAAKPAALYGRLVAEHNPHLADLFSESPEAYYKAMHSEISAALAQLDLLNEADVRMACS